MQQQCDAFPKMDPSIDDTGSHRRVVVSRITDGILLKVIGAIVTMLAAGVCWMISGQIDMQRRMAVLESNRFTSRDAAEFLERVQRIELGLAKLPTDNPPRWVSDTLSRIENRVEALSTKIDAIKGKQ